MRTSKLDLLVNVAAIVAALYLPACGGEQIDDPPVVTPPDPVVQMGTLEVSASGQMVARITIGTEAVQNGEPVALPFTTTLVVGNYHVTVVEMDGRKSEFDVNVEADKTTPVVIAPPPPDVSYIPGTWSVYDKNGNLISRESLTVHQGEPNQWLATDIPPCPTGESIRGFGFGSACVYSETQFAQYSRCTNRTKLETCQVRRICTSNGTNRMTCEESSGSSPAGILIRMKEE